MKLVIENIITDLRKYGISISDDMFNAMNEFADIENSYVNKIDINRWQDIKNKTVLFVDGGNILAFYGDGRFMYNPSKVKVSDAPNYDIYEVSVGGVNVAKRREQRRHDLSGLVSTSDSSLSNLPRSSQYVYGKDWDPEVNRVYYTKLLQQNKLFKYTAELNEAYKLVIKLIDMRQEETTIGKRTVYNDVIQSLVAQIKKIEMLIESVDKNFAEDDFDKLKKEIAKLPRLVEKGEYLIKTEKGTIRRFGHPKNREHSKIQK